MKKGTLPKASMAINNGTKVSRKDSAQLFMSWSSLLDCHTPASL
jgi:hypothetical protein